MSGVNWFGYIGIACFELAINQYNKVSMIFVCNACPIAGPGSGADFFIPASDLSSSAFGETGCCIYPIVRGQRPLARAVTGHLSVELKYKPFD